MDYLSHNVAINLKRIRKAKGMSLDVVAEQTGVSKSMLATIEKENVNPSIGVLGKIMSGLRIDLQDLTQAPQNGAYLVDINKAFLQLLLCCCSFKVIHQCRLKRITNNMLYSRNLLQI